MDFEYKLQSTIAMIYGDKKIQAILKRESMERWLRQAKEVVPRGWRIMLKRNWKMPRKSGRPRRATIPRGLKTPICDAVLARHREEVRKLAELKKAQKNCTCKTLPDHLLQCGLWKPMGSTV